MAATTMLVMTSIILANQQQIARTAEEEALKKLCAIDYTPDCDRVCIKEGEQFLTRVDDYNGNYIQYKNNICLGTSTQTPVQHEMFWNPPMKTTASIIIGVLAIAILFKMFRDN